MGSIQIIQSPSELVIRDPGYSWAAWIFWAIGVFCALSGVVVVIAGMWARRMAQGAPATAGIIGGSAGIFAMILLLVTLLFAWLGWRMRDSGVTATFNSAQGTVTISAGYYPQMKTIALSNVRQARVLTADFANSVGIEVEGEGLVRITGSSSRGGMQLAADAVNRFIGE
jgi:hypothetical protein